MHASRFSLIAVLGCIAMISAIPVGNRAAAEAIVCRQGVGLDIVTGTLADDVGTTTVDDLTSGALAPGPIRRQTNNFVGDDPIGSFTGTLLSDASKVVSDLLGDGPRAGADLLQEFPVLSAAEVIILSYVNEALNGLLSGPGQGAGGLKQLE